MDLLMTKAISGLVLSMSTVWSEYMPPLVMDSGLIDWCR
jgi:hypothetical protein